MARWWTVAGLGLLAWSQALPAQAQLQPPPGGPPVFAGEPRAPQGPEFCPPGLSPRKEIAIPYEDKRPLENAWASPCEEDECPHCFFFIGPLGWVREGLGDGVIAVRDPRNVDAGIQPPATSPIAINYNDITPLHVWGVQARAGYTYDVHTVELCGFYTTRRDSFLTVTEPTRLSLPFSAFPAAGGFQGNNGLWLNADQVTVRLGYDLGNFEYNYRNTFCKKWDCIVGLRYFDLTERFAISTSDDGTIDEPLNAANSAIYSMRAYNRIVCAQFGTETVQPIMPFMAVGWYSKNAVGVDFIDIEHRLERGDGLMGPGARRLSSTVSYIVETGGFLDFAFNDNFRFRGGYQFLWLGNVAEAHQQVSFDTTLATGNSDNRGNIFFHGPILEIEFFF